MKSTSLDILDARVSKKKERKNQDTQDKSGPQRKISIQELDGEDKDIYGSFGIF